MPKLQSTANPMTALLKWRLSLQLCKTHFRAYYVISILQTLLIAAYIRGAQRSYFGESIQHHMTLNAHNLIRLSLIMGAIFLAGLLFEQIDENHRHVISDLSTSIAKAWRRLLDIAVATMLAFIMAALLLLPFMLFAIYPQSQALIIHLKANAGLNSPLLFYLLETFYFLAIAAFGTYGFSRTFYAPIICAIHRSQGLAAIKASFKLSKNQWWKTIKTFWFPGIFTFLFIYYFLQQLLNQAFVSACITYALLFPIATAVLVIELRQILKQQNIRLEQMTRQSSDAW